MVKKAILFFILIVHAVATLGISLDEFYCCGKLRSVSLISSENKSGSCNKKMLQKDCCKHQQNYVKVKDVQHLSGNLTIVSQPNLFSFPTAAPLTPLQQVNEKEQAVYYPPPDFSPSPFYLLICVFRI